MCKLAAISAPRYCFRHVLNLMQICRISQKTYSDIALKLRLIYTWHVQTRLKTGLTCFIIFYASYYVGMFFTVYKEMSEAMNKHPDADVMINFASLRSAYDATLEAMQFPQVSTLDYCRGVL